jgi:hypothetical protein
MLCILTEQHIDNTICVLQAASIHDWSDSMAKKAKLRANKRVPWTKAHHAELRKHSKAKTPVAQISKLMKRTVGALRQQGIKLGIPLGHRR